MNHPEADLLLEEACRRGILGQILEEYIAFCHAPSENPPLSEKKMRSAPRSNRFPNLAGFYRYLGCSTDEALRIEKSYPEEFGRIRAILEDEALNAAMSPTVIAAYLKKRLGYEKESDLSEEPITVQFAHDIFGDGE